MGEKISLMYIITVRVKSAVLKTGRFVDKVAGKEDGVVHLPGSNWQTYLVLEMYQNFIYLAKRLLRELDNYKAKKNLVFSVYEKKFAYVGSIGKLCFFGKTVKSCKSLTHLSKFGVYEQSGSCPNLAEIKMVSRVCLLLRLSCITFKRLVEYYHHRYREDEQKNYIHI